MEQNYILEMRGISKEFPGVKALDDVNLELKPGEVHALVGENGAGKSTLMKILTGNYFPDEGEIFLRGKPVHFANPHQALQAGISIIHQELNLVPEMNASQNIFLGTQVATGRIGIIDRGKRQQLAMKALQDLNVAINVMTPIRRLSVAHQQMIEIAKALSIKSDILVMDEPTSALTDHEIETLYEVIFSLKNRGVAVIYISHRLDEVFHLADRITVLRDGRNVATRAARELTMDDLVRMMVGRELQRFFQHRVRPGAAHWNRDKGKQITLNLLRNYPDLKGIYAANDTMALGAVEALEEIDRLSEVVVLGTDGTPEAVEAIRAGRLRATLATSGYDYGRVGLELAIRALEGQQLPRRITWPAVLITSENLHIYFPVSGKETARFTKELNEDLMSLGPAPMSSRPYRIGVVVKTLENPYWRLMKQGYQEMASRYGVTVEVVAASSEEDEEEQLALAESLLAKGCDALCVSPISNTNLLPVINQAARLRLPVINVDDAVITEAPVTTVLSADQVAIGVQAVEYLKQQVPAGMGVTMIGGRPGSQASRDRGQGFYKRLKSAGLSLVRNRKVALEVKHLSTKELLKNVSFSAHWGEIFGIAGLVGAGRTELARAIFGADRIEKGAIYLDGQPVTINSPRDAIKKGIALVPEDRKVQGLVLEMPVLNNTTLTILDRLASWGFIHRRQRQDIAGEYVTKLAIKTPSVNQIVKFLSGGNQQKVVIAKWLASQARILIFDEPTRGIDIGAKVEVRELVNELVKEGVCVILISSELPELLGMCDRVIVMHEGQVTGEFEAEWTSEEEILQHASGLANEFVTNH